jgi:hypothetical protein
MPNEAWSTKLIGVSLHIPLWFALLMIATEYAPVVLAVAIPLTVLGLVVRGISRWLLLCCGVLLAASCAILPVMGWIDNIKQARAAAREAALQVTLSAPQVIDGLQLPAGTKVHWYDDEHTDVVSVDLPAPIRLLGIKLVGHIGHTDQQSWSATLAQPSLIDGWPCDKGKVTLSRTWRLQRCILASDHTKHRRVFPAGTEADLTPEKGEFGMFRLPAGRGMLLPDIAAILPPGSTLWIAEDGVIANAYIERATPLLVHGVELWGDVFWRYGTRGLHDDVPNALRGYLARPMTQHGRSFEEGEWVQLWLQDQVVEPAH